MLILCAVAGVGYGMSHSRTRPKPTKVVRSSDNVCQVTVPEDWSPLPPHPNPNAPKAPIEQGNGRQEVYLQVFNNPLEDLDGQPELIVYAESCRDASASDLGTRFDSVSDATTLTLDGHEALQVTAEGANGGVKIKWIQTVVRTERHYHVIWAWTLPSRFEKKRSLLDQVSRSFKLIRSQ